MYVSFGSGDPRHRHHPLWMRRTAGGGMAGGVLMIVVGILSVLSDAPTSRYDRKARSSAYTEARYAELHRQQEQAKASGNKGLGFLDGEHSTHTETRTAPDGSTYQIKVVDGTKKAPEPIDPLMPALVVGLGITMMGVSGAVLMLAGGRREPEPEPDAPMAPPKWEAPARDFSDEDVLKAMDEAKRDG